MLWMLLGCPEPRIDTQETGDCLGGETALAVGGTESHDDGSETWTEMVDGVEATMVHGPQGGWHVLASARAWNVDAIVTILYTITVEDSGAEISHNNYRVQLVEDEACSGYYPGMYGYLDVTGIEVGDADTPPELLAGAALLLHMEVTDESGHAAADDAHVVAALDPADQE